LDYDHTHFLSTFSDFFDLQKQNTQERLNWNTEAFITFQRKKWQLQFNTGLIGFREQLIEQNTVNKLTYFTFGAIPSYQLMEKKWGKLFFGLGTGIKSLIKEEGIYIDPNNVNEIGSDEDFFPTNNNLWFVTARVEAQIKITEKLSFYPQIRYENHPTSITTVEHPILFWRDVIGANFSMGWQF